MADTEHAPHLSIMQARQAFRGRHILMVLIASVALASLALAAAWGWRAGDFRHADTSAASRIAASQPATPTNPAPKPRGSDTTGFY